MTMGRFLLQTVGYLSHILMYPSLRLRPTCKGRLLDATLLHMGFYQETKIIEHPVTFER